MTDKRLELAYRLMQAQAKEAYRRWWEAILELERLRQRIEDRRGQASTVEGPGG